MTTAWLTDAAMKNLLAGHERYVREVSPHYDDVLREIAERAQRTGFLTKLDIGGLVLWKRLRANTPWVPELLACPAGEVDRATSAMCTAARRTDADIPTAAAEARAALAVLPGFRRGDALASALILAAAPDRMAVYDRRAQAGLECLGLTLSAAPGRYARYMTTLAQLAEQATSTTGERWTPRDVDCALYIIGGSGPVESSTA